MYRTRSRVRFAPGTYPPREELRTAADPYEHDEWLPVEPHNTQLYRDGTNTQLYGDGLQQLCTETRNNLQSLQTSMKKSDPCWDYGIKHWHPGSRPSSAQSSNHSTTLPSKGSWQDADVMFTNVATVESLGKTSLANSEESPYIEATEPVRKFCYLCTTMEEHERHRLHNTKPKKYRGRRWVDYIAPKPKVRRKFDDDEMNEINMISHLYKIEVWTGNKLNAGTCANVTVIIKGTQGLLPKTKLSRTRGSSQFCFMRNTRETFYVKGPYLGNLEAMAVEHDGVEEKHSWFLDKIEVTDMKTLLTWEFLCGQWFSLHIRDYRIQRDLLAKFKELSKREYKILVFTGKKHLSGTNSNVFLTLYGSERNSKRIRLDPTGSNKKLFERGNMDTFMIQANDVGKLRRIRVEHDGKGFAAGWFLDRIVIHPADSPQDKLYFLYNGWIARDIGDGTLWRELKARKSVPTELTIGTKITYNIEVHTGTKKYAGTDANVFIKMCGSKGTTKKIGLDDEKNNFERDMWDRFDREALDVGPLEKIIIGHDNFGPGAGWFLDKVKVTRYITKAEVMNYLKKIRKEEKEADDKKRKEEKKDLENISDRMSLSESRTKDSKSVRSRKKKKSKKRHGDEESSDSETETDSNEESSETSSDESDVDFYDVCKHRRKIRRELSKMQIETEREQIQTDRRRGRTLKQTIDEKHTIEEMMEEGYRIPLYDEYVFECQKWFAKDEGDGLYVRELPVSEKTTFFRD